MGIRHLSLTTLDQKYSNGIQNQDPPHFCTHEHDEFPERF